MPASPNIAGHEPIGIELDLDKTYSWRQCGRSTPHISRLTMQIGDPSARRSIEVTLKTWNSEIMSPLLAYDLPEQQDFKSLSLLIILYLD